MIKPKPYEQMAGQVFGYLTVLNEVVPYVRGQKGMRKLKCQCKCGAIIEVGYRNLKSGNTMSCGCYQKEMARKAKTVHGMGNDTPEYRTWSHIKGRCHNPTDAAYDRYGGRGIVVCERWKTSFLNFYTDMGDRPGNEFSLERIDNDGNYEPSNCKWDIVPNQVRNKRSNVWYEYNGREMIQSDWAIEFGIATTMLKHYLKTSTFEEVARRFEKKENLFVRNPYEHLLARDEIKHQLDAINKKYATI